MNMMMMMMMMNIMMNMMMMMMPGGQCGEGVCGSKVQRGGGN